MATLRGSVMKAALDRSKRSSNKSLRGIGTLEASATIGKTEIFPRRGSTRNQGPKKGATPVVVRGRVGPKKEIP